MYIDTSVRPVVVVVVVVVIVVVVMFLPTFFVQVVYRKVIFLHPFAMI